MYDLKINFSFNLCDFFLLSDRPQPPEGPVVFNEVYRNYMVISWNPPLDDGGCAISNYIIEKRDTNRDLWMPVTSSSTRTSCKVSFILQTLEQKKYLNKYTQPRDTIGFFSVFSGLDECEKTTAWINDLLLCKIILSFYNLLPFF